MARFLVTGGCGFYGSHLADSLVAEGHEVRILDDLSTGRRENAPAQAVLRIGDVAECTALTAVIEGVDGCFHLAAITRRPSAKVVAPNTTTRPVPQRSATAPAKGVAMPQASARIAIAKDSVSIPQPRSLLAGASHSP